MRPFEIFFTRQAQKDLQKLKEKDKEKLKKILKDILALNPNEGKKLLGELSGNFSYRLNLKDRIIYSVNQRKAHIYVKRCKTHYGD